jgi:hypothetical protein
MKVLMFGWEFPPHISGGLGTASFGLTKGLAEFDDLEVLFVVPKAYGDEDDTAVKKIIGANEISITRKHVNVFHSERQIDISEVRSNLVPHPPVLSRLMRRERSHSRESMGLICTKRLPIMPLSPNTLERNMISM